MFSSFRVGRITAPIEDIEGDCLESLTLFDGPDANPENIIKTFCDTFSRPMEKHDFISTGNTLFLQFISETGSYSGSSLYYWAHYDFFNNTAFGERISDTECDERFTFLRPRGQFSSPLNTIFYKKGQGHGVNCSLYFTSEPRYYGRIQVKIKSINFKSQNCVDKLTVSDPLIKGEVGLNVLESNNSYGKIDICSQSQLPITVISKYRYLNIKMQINESSSLSYFKSSSPLFSGTYEFMHPSICGETEFLIGSEGTLVFPNLYDEDAYSGQLGFGSVICLWELKLSDVFDDPEASLAVNIELVKFSSSNCEEDKLEISIPGTDGKIFSLCGQANRKNRDVSHVESTLKTHQAVMEVEENIEEMSTFDFNPIEREKDFLGMTTDSFSQANTIEDVKLSEEAKNSTSENNDDKAYNMPILLDSHGRILTPEEQKGGGGVLVKSSQNVAKPKYGKDKDSGRDSKGSYRPTESQEDRYTMRELITEARTTRPNIISTNTETETPTPFPTLTVPDKTTRKTFIPDASSYIRFKNSIPLTLKVSDLKEGRILVHLKVRDPTESFLQIFWTKIYPVNSNEPSFSPLESQKCDFLCPDASVCIPHRLVCNGIVNCPRTNSSYHGMNDDETEAVCNFFKRIPFKKMILGSLGISACTFIGFMIVAFFCGRKDREIRRKK
ncbi:hypothetical protein QYM36_016518 [Artemia franciscana]|uniref:CUB domain-containing protein n=1 Tax=Artemia franciscana TaxID=6661 RepID=A0AA88HGB1_ARTSF|nr:hypothetical protein QYM36_016518 [Artemia franciscana]